MPKAKRTARTAQITQLQQTRWLVIALGSVIITAWTLLRFWIQPIIFDAVGQQLLAHQWLLGFHDGAVMGPTNFIVKMFILYMPANLLPGSPYIKLIVMTILLNVVTYMVIFLCAEQILKRFGLNNRKPLWLAMLWVSVIAGSVFWIGFANSRNIEVAGGVLLIASGLLVTRMTHLRTFVLIALLCSVLFFADPLQLYMAAIPTLLFLILEWWRAKAERAALRPIIYWTGAIIAGYVLAQLLAWLVQSIWHVAFFAVGGHLALASLPVQAVHAVRQLLELYSGSADLGKIFLYVNPLALLALAASCIYVWAFKPASRKPLSWVLVMTLANIGIYVLSGSSGQDTNARYLIMTLPACIVSIATVLYYAPLVLRKGMYALITVLVISGCVLLAYNLIHHYRTAGDVNNHYTIVERYIQSNGYAYAFASMNTALPTMYLNDSDVPLLPLSCQAEGRIMLSNLFFDRGYTASIARNTTDDVPVLLDAGGVITNVPAVCTEIDITEQLGRPERSATLSDGSRVLLYNARTILQSLPLPARI